MHILVDIKFTYLIVTQLSILITKALSINPNSGNALVHMGFIVKSESKYEEAIPLLQRGIATGEPEVNDSRFFFHLGDAFYRTGKHTEVNCSSWSSFKDYLLLIQCYYRRKP